MPVLRKVVYNFGRSEHAQKYSRGRQAIYLSFVWQGFSIQLVLESALYAARSRGMYIGNHTWKSFPISFFVLRPTSSSVHSVRKNSAKNIACENTWTLICSCANTSAVYVVRDSLLIKLLNNTNNYTVIWWNMNAVCVANVLNKSRPCIHTKNVIIMPLILAMFKASNFFKFSSIKLGLVGIF